MSLRKAIDQKCKDCIYDEHEPGTWRMQVEDCTFSECSLWPVRTKANRRNWRNKDDKR